MKKGSYNRNGYIGNPLLKYLKKGKHYKQRGYRAAKAKRKGIAAACKEHKARFDYREAERRLYIKAEYRIHNRDVSNTYLKAGRQKRQRRQQRLCKGERDRERREHTQKGNPFA